MATFELYRRSTIGMCLTETLDEMVSNGGLSPELAIQVLVQFDKSMTEALETQVKSKVSIKGHLHTYRFCDNVWTFILQDATFKNEEGHENVGRVKIVALEGDGGREDSERSGARVHPISYALYDLLFSPIGFIAGLVACNIHGRSEQAQ
ncbi:unnamed protein product [Ilex paraguariensis]|uniref:Transcription initiation factor IIA subunit 2 n=1 Tax=Ilex paraguariensis TaxID=185542 RepID=A0ABC8UZR9_9AQUA